MGYWRQRSGLLRIGGTYQNLLPAGCPRGRETLGGPEALTAGQILGTCGDLALGLTCFLSSTFRAAPEPVAAD